VSVHEPVAGQAHAEGTPHEVLAHHFDTLEQQHEANTLGMWMFLATEVLFFGGLFLGYLVYRDRFSEAYLVGSKHLNLTLGAINTVVLLCSSLTVVLAIHAAQTGKRTMTAWLLATLLLGAAFLGIKAVEWYHDYEVGLIPAISWNGGPSSIWAEHEPPIPARQGEIFFVVYFCMTGLHALHMIIGLGVFGVLLHHAWRGRYGPTYYTPLEVGGLYWHFVDIVWIFLFPLLYLIRH
jgi:cytochrome c oxidase subunit 3